MLDVWALWVTADKLFTANQDVWPGPKIMQRPALQDSNFIFVEYMAHMPEIKSAFRCGASYIASANALLKDSAKALLKGSKYSIDDQSWWGLRMEQVIALAGHVSFG